MKESRTAPTGLDREVDLERDEHAKRRPSTLEAGVGVSALALSGAAAWIVVSGGVVYDATGAAIVLVSSILGFTAAGLLWRRSRPGNPLGPLLLGLAAASALSSLAGASSPGLYVVGAVGQWAFLIGAAWAMVTFPGGRLDPATRVVVAIPVAIFLLVQLPLVLTARTFAGVSAVVRCTTDCPANPLLVTARPGLAHALTVSGGVARLLWALSIMALLAVRYTRASRPRRRIVITVYATSFLIAAGFGLNGLLDALGRQPGDVQSEHIGYLVLRIVFPLVFIVTLLLAQAHAGAVLAEMARELTGAPPVAVVERLVRRVLDDPQARLAFWLPRLGRFADRRGRPVELDPASQWETWRSFGRGGKDVLAIVHDPALRDDPELVQAVGSAALMAFENRRLEQDLLDSIEALRASQRRLFMAAAAERRKIERNLHDSTQQKLVAIRIQLELAREQAAPQSVLRGRLAALGTELDDALDDLRAVAHGIYPPLLADEGLTAALREAARRAGIPVELHLQEVGRLPEEQEAAVYYCCLEALQNAAKHAGNTASVSLTLRREGRVLRFTVSDDGVGFAMRRRHTGLGLTSMADRLAAVGGSVTIRSAPGEGTTVDGRLGLSAAKQEDGHVAHV